MLYILNTVRIFFMKLYGSVEEVVTIYRVCKTIWQLTCSYLPTHAPPPPPLADLYFRSYWLMFVILQFCLSPPHPHPPDSSHYPHPSTLVPRPSPPPPPPPTHTHTFSFPGFAFFVKIHLLESSKLDLYGLYFRSCLGFYLSCLFFFVLFFFWQFDIIICSEFDNHASVKQTMSI